MTDIHLDILCCVLFLWFLFMATIVSCDIERRIEWPWKPLMFQSFYLLCTYGKEIAVVIRNNGSPYSHTFGSRLHIFRDWSSFCLSEWSLNTSWTLTGHGGTFSFRVCWLFFLGAKGRKETTDHLWPERKRERNFWHLSSLVLMMMILHSNSLRCLLSFLSSFHFLFSLSSLGASQVADKPSRRWSPSLPLTVCLQTSVVSFVSFSLLSFSNTHSTGRRKRNSLRRKGGWWWFFVCEKIAHYSHMTKLFFPIPFIVAESGVQFSNTERGRERTLS